MPANSYHLYKRGNNSYSPMPPTAPDHVLSLTQLINMSATVNVQECYYVYGVDTGVFDYSLSSNIDCATLQNIVTGNRLGCASTSLADFPIITAPFGTPRVTVVTQADLANAIVDPRPHLIIDAPNPIVSTSSIFIPNNTGAIKHRYFNDVHLNPNFNGHPIRMNNSGGYTFASESGQLMQGLTINDARNPGATNDGSIQIFNFTQTQQPLIFANVTFQGSGMTGAQVFVNLGTEVLFQDCVGYNFNPGVLVSGTNTPDFLTASGFPGNLTSNVKMVRCAADCERCDDGIDFFRGQNCQAIDCVIWNVGQGGGGGDGTGFKMGNGNDNPNAAGNNLVQGCLVVNSAGVAYHFNGNPNPLTARCNTAIGGGGHFALGNVINAIANISDAGGSLNSGSGLSQVNNSWQITGTGSFFNAAGSDYAIVPGSAWATMNNGQPGGASLVAIDLSLSLAGVIY